MNLLGGNLQPEVQSLEPLPGQANYFIGQDPKQWRVGVPTYAKIVYREVYPGVDLVYYGSQGQLEFDFVIQPGANPEKIQLRFEGVNGLQLDETGCLTVHLNGGSVKWPRPVVYQFSNGRKQTVSGDYVVRDSLEVAFHVSGYEPDRPLIIEPVLV